MFFCRMKTPNEIVSAISTAKDVSSSPHTETEMPTVENASSGGIN